MKDDKPVLGFVGAGFVGGAMIRGFSGYNDLVVYDKGKGIGSMEEVVEKADAIFVALPTPMRKDGSCDTRLIEEVVFDIDNRLVELNRHNVEIVIRSTVPPLFLRDIGVNLHAAQLIFMPEFLTERTADLDFIMASRFILGVGDPTFTAIGGTGGKTHTEIAIAERFPGTRIAFVSWEEASMIKYAANVFFTIKLSFFNELAEVCDAMPDCDWDSVRDELMNDGRIGRSHFNVPGPDGEPGWGGHCFPKDSAAYSHFVLFDLDKRPTMANAARAVNDRVRKNRDWEEQKGRAVSED